MGDGMLTLRGKVVSIVPIEQLTPKSEVIPRAASSTTLLPVVSGSRPVTAAIRRLSAFFLRDGDIPSGYSHYFVLERDAERFPAHMVDSSLVVLSDEFAYIGDGDIVRLNADQKSIRVLYRHGSPHNSILMTEQCQHYCLMCSQPPKNIDDSWLTDENQQLIRLMPRTVKALTLSGGEPTLFGNRFLETVRLTKNLLPHTKVQILSNGRTFAHRPFAEDYAAINHPDLTVGIPLYSDDASTHDYIVQAKGAFDETVRGILNLKELGQKVEIRVVLHALSIGTLESLANFIARNLTFVDHVALMGLEITGFTRANMDSLWIDQFSYKDILSRAVGVLEAYGIPLSVYNHQLCLVNDDVLRAYRRSISDWKNEYVDACDPCERKHECGGFFSSAVQHRYSEHIRPFVSEHTS
jgi:His-Xaa-Ser system radical SAM maturase HxsC